MAMPKELQCCSHRGRKAKVSQTGSRNATQACQAKLAPLEQQLAHQASLTDEILLVRAQQEVEQIRHERLRVLKEGLSRLVNAE